MCQRIQQGEGAGVGKEPQLDKPNYKGQKGNIQSRMQSQWQQVAVEDKVTKDG